MNCRWGDRDLSTPTPSTCRLTQIILLDGRPEVIEEVNSAPVDVKAFLAEEFERFLTNRAFLDALPGTLMPDLVSQQRLSVDGTDKGAYRASVPDQTIR